jgi:hypothetical protein
MDYAMAEFLHEGSFSRGTCSMDSPKYSVNRRRHARISCKHVLAFIKTETNSVLADVANISRSGMCFRSAEQFCPGTAVSVATHYIEGGQNIFQNGTIVRVYRPSGMERTEYGVEF